MVDHEAIWDILGVECPYANRSAIELKGEIDSSTKQLQILLPHV